ncbi:uncharacterized protein [Montipora capricornis]|uniref:uncharacterized protein n=1 Tax=Montipora capricornis TaxID=246305 RepID=UPI0035F1DE9D
MSRISGNDETVERHKVFTRNQESGETFDKYLTELRLLEKTCDFRTPSDSLLRDRIVCGLSSSTLRARLLREPNLNLKQCTDLCRASELSKEQNKSLDNTDSASRINSRKLTSQNHKSDRHNDSKPIKPCLYCGSNRCKEANHFAVCCGKVPSSKPSRPHKSK